ncbi:hypothetical protein JRQ81_000035 [Phrynocephalus forsythii]|uniref:Uncharacterized protein n=1 Tax=Phrynocephalus forsythii TaxID=171643 RepID=A0A9Q0X5Q5_9SAUR|nr:hypothetical protein JRQ81_000035 [Phrynocephalus forsythii]
MRSSPLDSRRLSVEPISTLARLSTSSWGFGVRPSHVRLPRRCCQYRPESRQLPRILAPKLVPSAQENHAAVDRTRGIGAAQWMAFDQRSRSSSFSDALGCAVHGCPRVCHSQHCHDSQQGVHCFAGGCCGNFPNRCIKLDTFCSDWIFGIVTGATVVFFAYVGFDAVANSAEESKNPKVGYATVCACVVMLRLRNEEQRKPT